MCRPNSDVYGMEPSRPEDYEAMDLDLIRARWQQKARRWDKDLADERFHLNEDDAYRRFLEIADQIVAERGEFCARHLLVDLACGTGLVLAHFIERFAEGLGIDLCESMLEMAAQRRLPRARFQAGNCFELLKFVAEAGAVLSRGILLSHYGERWVPVLLPQIRQVLVADGGFAILDFLNAAARHLHPLSPDNKTYYHAEQMEALGKQAGFRRSSILGEPQRRVLLVLLER